VVRTSYTDACAQDIVHRVGSSVRRVDLSDLDTIRALAHPRRQRMLQHLGLHGPMTSAGLARALGLNTGATSYHLRELAKIGFVEEVPNLAHGRERWWRAPRRDLRLPPRSTQNPALRSVLDEAVRQELADDFDEFLRYQLGDDAGWVDAALSSRSAIALAADEVTEFFDAYVALLNRYRQRTEAPADARTVAIRLLVFPTSEIVEQE
jgi:DNA-binding transcriptional ArsR family regulator